MITARRVIDMVVTTVPLTIRVAPKVKELIEQEAIKKGISQNEYVVGAVLNMASSTRQGIVRVEEKDFVETPSTNERLWMATANDMDVRVWRDDQGMTDLGSNWLCSVEEVSDISISDCVVLPPGGDEPDWSVIIPEVNAMMRTMDRQRYRKGGKFFNA